MRKNQKKKITKYKEVSKRYENRKIIMKIFLKIERNT